jgi:LPXTG-site transpeptidase (sortase) family protein
MNDLVFSGDSLIDRIMSRRWSFLSVFALAFLFSYLFLVAIDFIPEPPRPTGEDGQPTERRQSPGVVQEAMAVERVTEDTSLTPEQPVELPRSIHIKKLDRTINILNPVSRTVRDLDEALLSGVVRHPDAARLGQEGNVFILGHSSHLPQVFNQNFKAFNGIETLEWGDLIEITGDQYVYTYRVERVYEAKANDATIIPINTEDRRLTLATCNSFGSIDDRFIVEAVEVSVRPL